MQEISRKRNSAVNIPTINVRQTFIFQNLRFNEEIP